ncbi:major facilitator superfamily domain-containing protein 6 [Procambarus clarkii]|uniref:major facilitator superfamily domain-containing protein 6 n=1 Tax=Procambarus clarkii TaxID=6728 RepID=UPI0037448B3B
MGCITSGIQEFLSDLLDTRLLIIKVTYFMLLAGIVIVWPQLTLHQEELGLTTYHTGICSSVMSFLIILVPLLAGLAGDKLGNYKLLMSTATMVTGIGALLFTFVPSARRSKVTGLNGTTSGSQFGIEISSNFNNGTMTAFEVDSEKLVETFWYYLAVRTLFGMFQSVGYTLFEASVMTQVQERGINYGFQRAWGTLAVIVFSLISGYIIDKTGGFKMIFWVSAVLHIVSAALMLLLTNFKVPTQSLTKEIFKYLCNAEVILLFTALLVAGVFIGYLETFMYRYLFSLGASNILIGLTVTVGAPFELIITLVTSYFVRLMGHAPLIMAGLSAYAVRLVGMSVLIDPWWVLPLEMLESVANGLLFTAAIMYCTVLFPMDTITTFRGIFAVVYFGVGKLLGTAVGSEMREALGDRATFRVLAGTALAFTLIYCFAFCTLRRHTNKTFALKPSLPTKTLS